MTDTIQTPTTEHNAVQPPNVNNGASWIKGGHQWFEGFHDAVSTSYANMVNSPMYMTLYVLAVITMVARLAQVSTPATSLAAQALETYKESKGVVKIISRAAYMLFSFVAKYDKPFMNASFIWVVYLYKPSSKNMYFSMFLTLISIIFNSIEEVYLFLGSQLWFLFTQLRAPQHKMILASMVVLLILTMYAGSIDSAPVNADTSTSVNADTSTQSTTTQQTTTQQPTTTYKTATRKSQ